MIEDDDDAIVDVVVGIVVFKDKVVRGDVTKVVVITIVVFEIDGA